MVRISRKGRPTEHHTRATYFPFWSFWGTIWGLSSSGPSVKIQLYFAMLSLSAYALRIYHMNTHRAEGSTHEIQASNVFKHLTPCQPITHRPVSWLHFTGFTCTPATAWLYSTSSPIPLTAILLSRTPFAFESYHMMPLNILFSLRSVGCSVGVPTDFLLIYGVLVVGTGASLV